MDDKLLRSNAVAQIEVAPAPPEEKPAHGDAPAGHDTAGDGKKPPSKKPSGKHNKWAWLKEKLTRKEVIIGGIIFVVLLGGAIAFGLSNHAAAPKPVAKNTPKPPTVITSPLTGLPVTAAQAKTTVTGVMIENSDFARPQSGLREAGVVFEGIAEAGITRFLALYQEAVPANLGPIRSVRPYFLQWAMGFDAPIAHVGGSPEALADIKKWGAKDLDQFYNAGYYHRISSRFAPHNMYTSMSQLHALERSKGWTTSTFTGFARKKDTPVKTPTASSIDFSISSADYSVHYAYDPTNNAYLRSEGGAPHKDATTGKQLEPKVVIALVIPYSLESDGYHSDYATLGSGRAYFFQDGAVTIGSWSKTSAKSQIKFTSASGKPVRLNAGQTWISAVGAASNVTYK